jgi:hypothetical protein
MEERRFQRPRKATKIKGLYSWLKNSLLGGAAPLALR